LLIVGKKDDKTVKLSEQLAGIVILLIPILGICVWLIASLSWAVRWPPTTEAKAAAFVVRLVGEGNGTITRDEQAPGNPVTKVRLTSTEVTDADLKVLVPLTNLSSLTLGPGVTDAGLKELTPLITLTTLDLSCTQVTDAGLKELAALSNLTFLDLHDTKVTEAGLKELQSALPNCMIWGDVQQMVVADVAKMGGHINRDEQPTGTTVITVSLNGSRATGAGLKQLAGLNVTHLDLGSTQITDETLKEIAGFKSLTSLDLSFTKVTDASVPELGALRMLVSLDLSGTKVTDTGVMELQKALPNCKIAK